MIIWSISFGGNFFAAVKSFDANISTSGNFVLNGNKNLNCAFQFYLAVLITIIEAPTSR